MQLYKHYKKGQNMLKVKSKYTVATSVTSFWFLYCYFLRNYTPFSRVSIINVEKVDVC